MILYVFIFCVIKLFKDGRGDLYLPSSVKNALVYSRAGSDALGTPIGRITFSILIQACIHTLTRVDRNFNIWYQHSRAIRSVFSWGCPLQGFSRFGHSKALFLTFPVAMKEEASKNRLD